MDEIWEDEELTDVFDDRLCVALRLPKESTGGQQFSQIYPVSTVPSTFFIKSDGKVVGVIQGSCSKEELQQNAIEKLKMKPTAPQSEGASSSEIAAAIGEESEAEINANTSYSAEEKEAKINRARELIAMKQRKKAEEDKEKERNTEIERRRLGKDLGKLKEFKAEQEAKETRDALRKEKDETKIAREKVREQIKNDREARNAKYQQEKAERDEALKKKQQEKLTQQAEEAARIAAANSLNARIQFRLPDGSTINHIFEADEALQSAVKVVATNPLNPLGREFRLATIYPRRVFTSEDYLSTFRTLDLLPTSALLVLPPALGGESVRGAPASTGGLSNLLKILFSPFFIILQFLQTFLFGTPQNRPVEPSESSQEGTTSRSHGTTEKPPSSGDTRPQRRVGRLSDMSPDDDDQNTWNGNSTQQM